MVDRIVTHNGTGQDSEFQILWKVGDRTWATYCEVVQLNALDWYCELMGMKNASELLTNYTIKGSESEKEDDIIQARVCTVVSEDIRTSEEDKHSIHSSSPISSSPHPLIPNLDMHNFSCQELNDCINYKEALDNYSRNAGLFPYPMPDCWREFHGRYVEAARHNPHLANQSNPLFILNINTDNIYMLAQTLDTIIRALGQRPTSIPTGPRIVTHYVR